MTHDVESLSEKFHEIYQQEVKRQGAVIRHPDNYGDLAENVKEYDRVLARYVLRLIKEAEIEARLDELDKYPHLQKAEGHTKLRWWALDRELAALRTEKEWTEQEWNDYRLRYRL